MKLIQDQAELVKLIDGIASRGKRLDADIQLAGLSSLAHLKDHGDVGFVNRLYNALPRGARKAAMSSWMLAYGSVHANTDTATKAEKPFVYTKDKKVNLEAASADPWFDHKADPAPDEVFDLQKAIEGIIKRAQGKELAQPHLLTKLQELVVETVTSPETED